VASGTPYEQETASSYTRGLPARLESATPPALAQPRGGSPRWTGLGPLGMSASTAGTPVHPPTQPVLRRAAAASALLGYSPRRRRARRNRLDVTWPKINSSSRLRADARPRARAPRADASSSPPRSTSTATANHERRDHRGPRRPLLARNGAPADYGRAICVTTTASGLRDGGSRHTGRRCEAIYDFGLRSLNYLMEHVRMRPRGPPPARGGARVVALSGGRVLDRGAGPARSLARTLAEGIRATRGRNDSSDGDGTDQPSDTFRRGARGPGARDVGRTCDRDRRPPARGAAATAEGSAFVFKVQSGRATCDQQPRGRRPRACRS